MKTTFLLAGILAATLSRAGDSAPFSLDTRTGIRPSRETEPLAYSTEWNGAASCSIALDGAPLLSNTTETGTFTWHTDGLQDGLHTLTFNDGVETLDAQFYINPGRIVFDANGGEETMPDFTLFPGAEQTLPESTFTKDGHFLLGWAFSPDGEATLLDGDSTADIVAEAGETVTLYAVWYEGTGRGRGPSVKYYDISSSGYSTWSASETSLTNYFAAYTPTIVTNTLDWGETLDAGFAGDIGSMGDRWVSAGLTRPTSHACRFSGKYAIQGTERFAINLSGMLRIGATGTYRFAAVADDSIVLYVDGTKVLWNDESWGNVGLGEIALSAGLHTIEAGFFEVSGGQGLSIQWKKPGDSSYAPIPQTFLFDGNPAYAIRFDANGGDGAMAKRVYAAGEEMALPAMAFTRDGWTFVGWATEPDGPVVYGETIEGGIDAANGATVTLYARWAQSQYAVHFNANGGEGTMADESFWIGIPGGLSSNAFARTGYAFAGWATAADGAVDFSDKALVTNLTETANATANLYAAWEPHQYAVRFNRGAGTGSMAIQQLTYDTAADLMPNAFTRTGYTFAGWATESGGEKIYDDGAEVLNLAANAGTVVNLYTTWTPNEYTVKFDANGGTGTMADLAFTYDQAATLTANAFARANRFFAGWATEADGAVVFADGEEVSNLTADANGEVTLYAVWADSRVVFDANGGEGTMEPFYLFAGVEQTLSQGTFTKDGHFLLGWSLTPDGEATLLDGDSTADIVAAQGGTVTLYAVWHEGSSSTGGECATGGNANWFVQTSDTHDGIAAARSGAIGDSQSTWLETTVTGSGTISFWWKVSSEGSCDYLRFYVDGSQKGGISGGTSWGQKSFAISGDGEHTIRWTYSKDGSVSSGSDCGWVGEVTWPNSDKPHKWVVGSAPPQLDGFNASYAVCFDANGGEGAMAKRVYASGADVTLAANSFARDGWTFVGWATEPDGPVAYADGETIEGGIDAANGAMVTLYARWAQSQYAVHFNANGGEGTMADESLWLGIPDTLPTSTFTRTGYTFAGWATIAGGEIAFADRALVTNLTETANATANLYAAWEPHQYAVRFNRGAGTGSMANQQLTYDTAADLTPNAFTRTGYTFAGWATEEGGAKVYDDGAEVLNLATNAGAVVDLYTTWTPNEYTVKFDANGGTGTMADLAFTYDQAATFTANAFTRASRFFAGWATEADGSVVHTDGAEVSNLTAEADGAVTLYAVWADSRVVFDANGGEGTMDPFYMFAGTEQTLPSSSFTKAGHFLLGWALTPDGEATLLNGDSTADIVAAPGETVTLYAVWHEGAGGGSGLSVKYYDISSSGYSTWTQSETALTNYFAAYTPTIETNSLDFGMGLATGHSHTSPLGSSDLRRIANFGMTALEVGECRFHGKYALPGTEYFAILMSGWLSIDQTGSYSFAAVADDYVVIYIDGVKMANSQWATIASGSITLEAGLHSISIGYYEIGGGQGFTIQWKRPTDSSYSPIPQSVLSDGHTAAYAVRFDANGGTGTMPKRVYATGDDVTLPAAAFARDGWAFVGWAPAPDGPVVYAAGEMVEDGFDVDPGATGTLYAHWSQTVSFDATGGTVAPESKCVTFDCPYGELPTPECEGYVFLDWRLNGSAVDESTVVSTTEFHTLSARWGIAVGNGVWEMTICDEPIVLGEPEVAPSGAVAIPSEIAGRPVVAIGADAFAGNSAITAIEIPASVTNIAEGAFAGCSGLRKVEIPSLYGRARFSDLFPNATAGMEEIVLLDGETNIANGAFKGCSGLRKVEIPSLYGRARFSELFPDATASIEEVAFLDGVAEIPDNFFEGCAALRSMDIAESVAEIGTNVFEACSALATTTVGGLEMYQGWCLGFAEDAGPASQVASLEIPEEYEDETARPEGSPHHGTPYRVRGIAAGAFKGEYGIATLSLPESLAFIGAEAFEDCTGLEDVAVPEGVATIDREAFRNCTYAQTLALPATLRTIGDGAFANASSLMSLALPEGVREVGAGAFSNCWRAVSVSIPQSVESVGEGAFADCRRVVGVTVPLHIAPMETLFPAAFAQVETVAVAPLDGSLGELAPPEAEAWLASRQMVPDAFKGCAAVEGIALPEWVANIPDGAFENCTALTTVSMPDGVTNIAARAFAGDSALAAFAFPAGLASIGEGAFAGCAGVGSLALPEGLRSIGDRAFEGLSLLARADIPASVREIGAGAFAGCGAIRAVSLPGGAGTLSAAFPDAYAGIVSATVVAEDPAGEPPAPRQNALCDALFAGCAALSSVELPPSLGRIGADAFRGCTALAQAGIPATVTNIGERAFAGCSTLSSVALPKNLETLRAGSFADCTSLSEITIPESVVTLERGVFDGCSRLLRVNYVGNAPAYSTADGGPYAGIAIGATSYVENGSTGWDGIATSKALPEYWPNGTTHEIAFWTPNRFAVSFDPNWGGAAAGDVEQVTGTSCALPPEPVRQGARFAGWWTAPENGARVTSSSQVTATRPYTIYAHWTMNRYTVHFDANGGSGEAEPFEMTVGTAAALPECPFSRPAHAFAGWATEPDGEVAYADGAEVQDLAWANNAAVTLYAVWRARDWTLADYLDAPKLSFETAGDVEWGPDWADFKEGGVALASGVLPPAADEGGESRASVRTTVVGAGTVSFWWKVSCEPEDPEYGDWFDYAEFAVDGETRGRVAGESGWRRVECRIEGAGEHTLEWAFVRDDYDEEDATYENRLWLDGVEWTPDAVTVSFAAGEGAEGEIPTGDVPEAVVRSEGFEMIVPGPGSLACDPYSFGGWSDGENIHAPGDIYVFGSADATLTAVWALKVWTLGEAVDAAALEFTTGGDAEWTVDAASGWTNGVSAKSGTVASGQTSWIETSVTGAGTLSLRWKVMGGVYRNKPFAYAAVERDGEEVAQTHSTDGEWAEVSVPVEGSGTHVVRIAYQRSSARACDGDCAWIDAVAWTPEAAESVIVQDVEIPVTWLDMRAASFVSAVGGDREAAARATAANGRPVWECYVADLDPEDPADDLVATIEMVDGEARVSILKGESADRAYETQGAPTPSGPWGAVSEESRFFRMKVILPE